MTVKKSRTNASKPQETATPVAKVETPAAAAETSAPTGGADTNLSGPDATAAAPAGAAAGDVAIEGAVLILDDGSSHPVSSATLAGTAGAQGVVLSTDQGADLRELVPLTRDPDQPLFSVSAPNGPRWRIGIEFGPQPRNITGRDLGDDPDGQTESLIGDPHLRIAPPITPE